LDSTERASERLGQRRGRVGERRRAGGEGPQTHFKRVFFLQSFSPHPTLIEVVGRGEIFRGLKQRRAMSVAGEVR
jgi:hypothetical protein